MLYEHGFLAVHYTDALKQWSDADYYDQNVKRIQLPYSMAVVLTPDQQRDKRREMAKKLVEMNARKRDEKVISFILYELVIYACLQGNFNLFTKYSSCCHKSNFKD